MSWILEVIETSSLSDAEMHMLVGKLLEKKRLNAELREVSETHTAARL